MLKKDGLIEFGRNLFTMRKNKHMSQRQLADKLDVDSRQISRYENGEAEMGALLYDKMLTVLGQKPDDSQAQELLLQFASLSPENKQRMIDFGIALNMTQKKAG